MVFSEPLYKGPIWIFLETYYQGRLPYSVVEGINYTLMYCKRCDFYWQKHILKYERMVELYELWLNPQESLSKHVAKSTKQRLELCQRIARELAYLGIESHTQPKVLDFGGGWGQWCLAAKVLGCNPYLLDLSETRRQFNAQQGIACLSDLSSWEPESFALINASQVFEHIPDPMGTLRQLTSLVKRGGGIHLDVPNVAVDLQFSTRAKKGPFQPLEHINGFTPKSLARLVEQAGLKRIVGPEVAIVMTRPRFLLSAAKQLALQTWLSRWLIKPSTSVLAVLHG